MMNNELADEAKEIINGAPCIGCGESATTIWSDPGISYVTCGAFVCKTCWERTNRITSNAFHKAYETVHKRDVEEYEARNGGRKPCTVGEAVKYLSGLPRDMPLRVDHRPRDQQVGGADPMFYEADEVDICGIGRKSEPLMKMTGKKHLMIG